MQINAKKKKNNENNTYNQKRKLIISSYSLYFHIPYNYSCGFDIMRIYIRTHIDGIKKEESVFQQNYLIPAKFIYILMVSKRKK